MSLLRVAALALGLLLLGCTSAPAPVGTPAATLAIAATNSVFDKSVLEAPADAPFAIVFTNNDTVPHNVAVSGGPPGTKGEIFTGPATRTYVFPAMSAGTYSFLCDVHPEMAGTLTVQ